MSAVAIEVCTVDHVVKALNQRSNAGPATIKQICDALPAHLQKPKSGVVDAVAEAVREGRVWQFATKGKNDHFWTQSPTDYASSLFDLAMQQSPGGITEKALTKKLDSPFLKDLINPTEFFASLVAQSRLFPQPKARKGDVKYGLEPVRIESPESIAWTSIENKLRQSPNGQTDAELAKLLKVKPLKGVIDPKQFIDLLVSSGRIFIQPNAPKEKGTKYSLEPYWTQARLTAAFARAEEHLQQSSGGVSELDLISLIDAAALEGKAEPTELLRYLVSQGRIFVQPSITKPSKKDARKYTLKPFSYIDQMVEELVSNVTRIANENNLDRMTALDRLVAAFNREVNSSRVEQPADATPLSAEPVPAPVPASPLALSPAAPAPQVDPKLGELILQAMREVNPRADDGDLVLIRELRQRLDFQQIEKSRFDQTLLDLFMARKVILSKTSAGLVSDEDRQIFVADAEGNFYNTVAYWKAS